MDYKNSRMVGDDCIRIPFNCDQGFEEYYLVYVGKSPYEHERHLDKVVCSRGPLTAAEHQKCKVTGKDACWKDSASKAELAKLAQKPEVAKVTKPVLKTEPVKEKVVEKKSAPVKKSKTPKKK